jgi:putative glutathione S-transferase
MSVKKDVTAYGNTWEQEIDDDGAFIRHPTSFRSQIKADGSSDFSPELGRYHLYVSLACPWAHRTLIGRKLKGLESVISVDVVDPILRSTGWSFDRGVPGATGDTVNHFDRLRDAYLASSPGFEGAITVPVLWDKRAGKIVNNESAEILRMFNTEFQEFSDHSEIDLYPKSLRKQIDSLNAWIYPEINNGVYRCGFARNQKAYSSAFRLLFSALDRVEGILADARYLTGAQLTEADVRLFTTLIRFDSVYFTHFKCNLRRIVDYPNTWDYVRDIYQLPGVEESVDMDHIKRHYFESHRNINPLGIVPDGPELDLSASHDRARLGNS